MRKWEACDRDVIKSGTGRNELNSQTNGQLPNLPN